MATYEITSPDGQKYKVTAPDSASQDEVLAYAQKSFKLAKTPTAEVPSKPLGQQLNEFIDDIPRQAGRAGRAALEGVGNTVDFLTAPVRNTVNSFLADSQSRANAIADNVAPSQRREPFQFKAGAGAALADLVGLPKPQNGTERVVDNVIGAMAGGAVPMAVGAQLSSRGTGVARGVGEMMAANPVQQMGSAAAAGGAGGYVRETGGDERSQILASLIAGIGAPMAMSAGQRVAQAGSRLAGGAGSRPIPTQTQVDVTINNALRDAGTDIGQLPPSAARSLRDDVSKAMRISDNLDAAAVRRLADYHVTGLTPTQARLTLDPADITRQANIAKQGANSTDTGAQALARMENANNKQLTAGLNALGANTSADAIAGATPIMKALGARDSAVQNKINARYDTARASDGRSALLDQQAFADRANSLLDNNLLGGKLPADVRNVVNKKWTEVVEGGTPPTEGAAPAGLSVDAAEQIKTRIAALQRSSSDAAERKALGLVRQALDDTPLAPGQEIGKAAVDAFNSARTLNRRYMKIVEKTPALQAVRDGVQPDKFVNDYIISGGSKASIMDVAKLKSSIKSSPEAMQAVREQIVSNLKQKALSGAEDEVGNFSQSAYKKALDSIGDRKLKLFFDQKEIDRLHAIGRVASYEQFQPRGSAVNNSNSAGAMGNVLERVAGSSLLGKIPLGRQVIGEPAQNISISMRSGRALDAPRSIALPSSPVTRAPLPYSVSPAILTQQQQEDAERRRMLGLD